MNRPDIVFFDLDHTLIDTDCEWAWKNMLADMGLVPDSQRARQDRYMELHAEGKTPAEEYLDFILSDFTGNTPERMAGLAGRNFDANIRHTVFDQAADAIADVLSAGGKPVLLSGSVRPVLEPVAAHLGFGEILCTELEVVEGRFSGRLASDFCIREGKLKRARDYCAHHGHSMREAGFFGDSLSDVQMFEQVGQATVVNPRARLTRRARQNGWRVVRWGKPSEPR